MIPGVIRRHALLSGVVLAAVGIGGGFAIRQVADAFAGPTISTATQLDAAQVTRVESSFSDAMRARQALDAPPAATYGALAASALAAGRPAPAVTAAMRDQQLRSGMAILNQYFTAGHAHLQATNVQRAVTSGGRSARAHYRRGRVVHRVHAGRSVGLDGDR